MSQSPQPPRSRGSSFAADLKPLSLALGLVFGYGAGLARNAQAATITVNNLAGGSVVGQCTLRDAVAAADTDAAVNGCAAGSGTDVIQFSVTGQIDLATEIVIGTSMTIAGPGSGAMTLAPSGTNRALNITGTPAVTISGVTFQGNGTSTVRGAAIHHGGSPGDTTTTIAIQNCRFNGNATNQQGGALFVYNAGAVSIASSTFTGNSVPSRGGAVKLYKVGPVTITDSTFSGNSASRGGALFLYKTSTTTISGSTFSGNVGSGVSARGAAVFLYRTSATTISDSTFSGNTSSGRGGALFLYKVGATSIVNSTISGNSTTSASVGGGAGIYLYKSPAGLTIANSTITDSTMAIASGAIVVKDDSTLTLQSTIVANTTEPGGNRDLSRTGVLPTTINATESLVFNPGGFINGTDVANITGQNPQLGPLAGNGGRTRTHALQANSPAIDKGSNPLALAFDQRGAGFTRTFGAQTDIGAFEVQPPKVQVPVPTLSSWGAALLAALLGAWAFVSSPVRRRRDRA